MNLKRFIIATLLLSFCISVTGCKYARVGVSGFSNSAYTGGKAYWLLPGNRGVTANDLEFQEYAAQLRLALNRVGFKAATNFDLADVGIFVTYGVGDPIENQYSYSLPVYGQTGGGTYNFSANTYSGYGSATTHGTIQQQPQYGVIGLQQVSGSTISYLRYLNLDAIDLRSYRGNNETVSAWRTDILSRGSRSDFRVVFPILVIAATPYFGKNTHKQITVDVQLHDKRLREFEEFTSVFPGNRLSNTSAGTHNGDLANLTSSLKADSPEEVIAALKGLQEIGASEAVPAILPLLKNSDGNVICEACRALSVLGSKDTIPAIKPLVDGPIDYLKLNGSSLSIAARVQRIKLEKEVRKAARDAISKLEAKS